MRQLGGAFGVAIVVAVFTGAGSYASPGAFSDGVVAAMAVCAALSFAGAGAGLLVSRSKSRTAAVSAGTTPVLESGAKNATYARV